jgi:hypothetical protein
MDKLEKSPPPVGARRRWEVPALKQVGKVGDVLQSGQGKSTVSALDSGDGLKPKGQG